MRLLSYWIETVLGGEPRVGAEVADGRVVDICFAHQLMLQRQHGIEAETADVMSRALVPPIMLDFIKGGDVTLEAARAAVSWAEKTGDAEKAWRLFAEDQRLPLIPNAPMLRDFMVFEEHLKNIYPRLGREIPPEWYNIPVYYKGNPGSLGVHGADVKIPNYCENFDFEFEFAAIIGRGGHDIDPADTFDHIYGYTIYNDFSARDMQAREMSVGLGPAKGKDFQGAHVLGPVLVTRDEIPNIYALAMSAKINGQEWCKSSTGTMHWRFEDMISHASRDEVLRVGEIFGTGTVGGGSTAERGGSLKRGDTVTLMVEKIGTLENRVA